MGLLDPNTSDGRVIFFLPWQGNVIAVRARISFSLFSLAEADTCLFCLVFTREPPTLRPTLSKTRSRRRKRSSGFWMRSAITFRTTSRSAGETSSPPGLVSALSSRTRMPRTLSLLFETVRAILSPLR